VYQLFVRAEQSPRSDSRVTLLEGDEDSLGLPRLDLNWKVHPDDDLVMRRGLEILGAELGAVGLGRLWTSARGERLEWTVLPGGHHMGTLRMSADPAMGVVDQDCRCHDVDNLYVAGSAVFPTGAAANPTLTIVALAERLAAHLMQELS
jgi:choline dehydrogenase-like flavoprotein